MSVVARLADDRLDARRELAELLAQANTDSAIVSFVGIARPHSKPGLAIHELVLEAHPAHRRAQENGRDHAFKRRPVRRSCSAGFC